MTKIFNSITLILTQVFSQLLQVLINDQKRAWAVKYEKYDEIHVVRARKEIILSGGALMTPHVLMHSGVGECSHLQEFGVS